MPQSLEALMKSRKIAPREVNFAAPWEARAFALAHALVEHNCFTWDDFRDRLIAAIGKADAGAVASGAAPGYYECWLVALEGSITAKAIATVSEIDRHADRIAANPPMPTKAVSTGPIKIA
jgi:nitrile hydratase accessory protein